MLTRNRTPKNTDTVYFNVEIPYNPNGDGVSPAIYRAQLNQPILDNPQDYHMAVVRFQVSGINIPIFIARILPFPNTDLNKTIYSVGLGYTGIFSDQEYVEFVQSDFTATPSLPLTASHPVVDYTPYYYVFDYQDFLTMINNALRDAFTNLGGKVVLPVGAVAPYFIFDPISERISLIAQQAYYDLADNNGQIPAPPANPITIYVNSQLFHFLDAMLVVDLAVNSSTGRDEQMIVKNFSDTNWYWPSGPAIPAGNATLLQMQQQYPALSDWNSIQSIQLVSNVLPINKEFVPSFNPLSNGVVNSLGIISDFIPLVDFGPEFRTSIEFVANGPWRLIDMYGDTPVTQVDLYFYWTDELGTQRVINVPVGKVVTAKLMFIKKEINFLGK